MQLDQEFIKWLIAQAIGLVVALVIFQAYRGLAEQLKVMNDVLMGVVKDNTASNIKLIVLIEEERRNTLRKSDIEAMLSAHGRNSQA